MPRYVAFLRAINVGGHVVKMDALRGHFESLGFSAVETFIASGNVIFQTRAQAVAAMEAKIEKCLQKALGYEVATFVRTDAEVAAVATYKPFPDKAHKSATTFCVGFLAAPLGAEGERALMGFKNADDDFHVNGREVYWLSKKLQHESTFTNVAFERAARTRATFRGMKTILKLTAKYPASGVSHS